MTYLERYRAGEREAVWSELGELNLTACGEVVHRDALEVAREATRRARANVESLVGRLEGIGLEFGAWNDNATAADGFEPHLPWLPPDAKSLERYRTNQSDNHWLLDALEHDASELIRGTEALIGMPLPLSFCAWLEIVG